MGEMVIPSGGTIVTEAVADFEASATEVAVTEILAGFGTAEGAVYSPPVLMVPHADPLQPEPETVQVTAVFVVFATVAVNCWWAPVTTSTIAGTMVTATGGRTVTVAVADLVGSATEVAVTETWGGDGTDDGAV